ncbi:hypothetical protein TcWFU_005652 [Taenia crassiceps]|uniref:RRM domain-containing protein n=1 Tax=Taenia crassiceps TaxID=6207 RepID=A0ABR4QRX3_9CEST
MSYGRSPPRIDGMVSLKVDNLAYRTTVEDLRRIFSRYGEAMCIFHETRIRWTVEKMQFGEWMAEKLMGEKFVCSVPCMVDRILVDAGGVYQHLGVDDQGLTPRVVDPRIAMTMMIIRKINTAIAALALEIDFYLASSEEPGGTWRSGFCPVSQAIRERRELADVVEVELIAEVKLTLVALPSVGYAILQDIFVNRKLVSGFSSPETRKSLCYTCLEIRGSLIQMVAGVAGPILFSVSSCASASISYRTFPIPELTNYGKVIGLVRKACGSFPSTLFLLTLVNAIIGGFITEKMVEQHALISAARETVK